VYGSGRMGYQIQRGEGMSLTKCPGCGKPSLFRICPICRKDSHAQAVRENNAKRGDRSGERADRRDILERWIGVPDA